ncbi:hypothetical protein [Hyunsoonleella aestuarii]|nr:hypothetical protein [Hyunsoonleella aestuarii]
MEKFIFTLLLIYSLITIARSFSLSLQDWVTNFGNVYMALAWLTPTLLIVGLKIENWKQVYKAINFMFLLMIIAFIFYLTGFQYPDEEWTWLLRPINFILLTVFYKYKILRRIKVIFLITIYFYIAVYTKFRFEFLYTGMVIGFLAIDKLLNIKLKRTFLKYVITVFILVMVYIFTAGYQSLSNLIASFVEYQDSRTFLFTELFADLNKSEVIFGRGSLGTYYSDFFERTNRWYRILGNKGWRGDNVIRITTEVGYLQMILKGGFAMLVLYTSLGLYAAYLALFRANNKFIRRLGFYILIILILSIISLRPAFTPTFIIFWIAIGTVSVKKYRQMSNEEINELIQ